MQDVTIYTDGSALPTNPGKGGWTAIILNGDRTEICGGFRWTTNNRMEITAVLKGLESLSEPSKVTVWSDSTYVVEAINKWMFGWERKGWRRKTGPLLNADLWKKMFTLCEKHTVRAAWVRGHSGDRENERADALANGSAYLDPTAVDEVYERFEVKR